MRKLFLALAICLELIFLLIIAHPTASFACGALNDTCTPDPNNSQGQGTCCAQAADGTPLSCTGTRTQAGGYLQENYCQQAPTNTTERCLIDSDCQAGYWCSGSNYTTTTYGTCAARTLSGAGGPCDTSADCNTNSNLTCVGATYYQRGTCTVNQTPCPVCASGSVYSYYTSECVNESTGSYTDPTFQNCTSSQQCSNGNGCLTPGQNPQQARPLSTCGDISANGTCPTALGPIPTNPEQLIATFFGIILSLAGVITLALIIFSGYRLMISQGNPEQVKNARDQLTAAIIGLLFIIFSFVILQVISFNILNIPGFGG